MFIVAQLAGAVAGLGVMGWLLHIDVLPTRQVSSASVAQAGKGT